MHLNELICTRVENEPEKGEMNTHISMSQSIAANCEFMEALRVDKTKRKAANARNAETREYFTELCMRWWKRKRGN